MKTVNNEKGITLVVVMMVLVVVSILGLSMMGLAAASVSQSTGDRDSEAAYYIAEGGARLAAEDLRIKADILYDQSSNNSNEFFEKLSYYTSELDGIVYRDDYFSAFSGSHPEAIIKVTPLEKDMVDETVQSYVITSTGRLGSRTRTVQKTVSVTWEETTNQVLEFMKGMALFSRNDVFLEGGPTIDGSLGTNSTESGAITLTGNPSLTGDLYLRSELKESGFDTPDWMEIKNNIIWMEEEQVFAMPEFPDFPDKATADIIKYRTNGNDSKTLELPVDEKEEDPLYISELRMESNTNLTIPLEGESKSLVVDHLNIQNGQIHLTGEGHLDIYVKEAISMGSGSTINTGKDSTQLNIYFLGSGNASSPREVKLSGDQQIYGSLFAEDANLDFGGGSGFFGHIVTGGRSVKIGGGSEAESRIFFAPEADLTLSGGGTVVGSVLVNSVEGSGGGTIRYLPWENTPVPFFPDAEESSKSVFESGPIREK
ncbi:DUF7305 domain-containing protein [Alteribacter natronophilus]|uniref:DUF7305 domain-containing protein n=1 Tax=Alteribacter natronophilus TaxID=2583810 RepID=UPI00110E4296|nr:PilX N-terminal domain-containing pilus assembly protein [Alteribacter natronophilus]TMW72051.1 hypothetical protein FGB90_07465 [Alteribacter natronophilus]